MVLCKKKNTIQKNFKSNFSFKKLGLNFLINYKWKMSHKNNKLHGINSKEILISHALIANILISNI